MLGSRYDSLYTAYLALILFLKAKSFNHKVFLLQWKQDHICNIIYPPLSLYQLHSQNAHLLLSEGYQGKVSTYKIFIKYFSSSWDIACVTTEQNEV